MVAGPAPRRGGLAPEQASPARDALWFALPGLVHQLGNALFAVQGHAMGLTRAGTGADQAQRGILGATERASGALAVLRCLLPDSADLPIPAHQLLTQIAELLRVPMRERGLRLELSPRDDSSKPGPDTPLAGAAAARRLVAGVHCLVAALPTGTRGTVQVSAARGSGAAMAVDVAFVPDPGTLPFPIDYAAVGRCVDDSVGAAAVRRTVGTQGMELVLPTAVGPQAPEASGSLHDCLLPPT